MAIAVSGGADSIYLLDELARIRLAAPPASFAEGLAPTVLHVDHGVRDGSRADADFVAAAAAGLGLPCERLEADPARILKNGRASEARLRSERYRLLGDVLRERAIRTLYVAHHRDDQVETILLAMLRGAGLRGLSGMARRRRLHSADALVVRPVIHVARASIETVVRDRGLLHRIDPTNEDRRFLRNRLRHDLLPRWRDELGDDAFDARILKLGRIARVLDRRRSNGSDALHRRLEEVAGRSLSRRLSLILQDAFVAPERSVHTIRPGRRVEVGGGTARRLAEPERPSDPPGVGFHAIVRDDPRGRVARVLASIDPILLRRRLDARGRLLLDAGRVRGRVAVRARQPGGRYRPIGAPGPVRLKKLLQSRRRPGAERRERLVLEDEEGIVGGDGLPPAARVAIDAATRQVLRVRFAARIGPVLDGEASNR